MLNLFYIESFRNHFLKSLRLLQDVIQEETQICFEWPFITVNISFGLWLLYLQHLSFLNNQFY